MEAENAFFLKLGIHTLFFPDNRLKPSNFYSDRVFLKRAIISIFVLRDRYIYPSDFIFGFPFELFCFDVLITMPIKNDVTFLTFKQLF